jgi:hypothetical protein
MLFPHAKVISGKPVSPPDISVRSRFQIKSNFAAFVDELVYKSGRDFDRESSGF